MVVLSFYVLVFNFFCAVGALCMFSYFYLSLRNTGKISAHLAYDMFLWYKYLIVNLVFFPISVFGVGIFF